MVTITNVLVRESESGSFTLMELSGDLELIQSMKTGRFYATLRKCNISCTLDVETAKRFIGKQMPGNIVRVPVDSYEYTLPETGEVITLTHRWDYMPEYATIGNNHLTMGNLVVS